MRKEGEGTVAAGRGVRRGRRWRRARGRPRRGRRFQARRVRRVRRVRASQCRAGVGWGRRRRGGGGRTDSRDIQIILGEKKIIK